MTSNVTLWPQMDVLLANPASLEALTAEQRGWIEEAARDAAARSAALADKDAQALGVACESGARFAEASDADLAALEAAFAPVYADLQQHPETKAFIDRIQALKGSTPPEPELAIPSDCTGKAPEQAARGTGTAPAHLNGTYRYVLTKEDARKAGEPELERISTGQHLDPERWAIRCHRRLHRELLGGREPHHVCAGRIRLPPPRSPSRWTTKAI